MLLNVLSSLALALSVSTILFALHALWLRRFGESLGWAVAAVVSSGTLVVLIESGYPPRRVAVAACLFGWFLWRLRFADTTDRPLPRPPRPPPARTTRA